MQVATSFSTRVEERAVAHADDARLREGDVEAVGELELIAFGAGKQKLCGWCTYCIVA